MRNFAIFFIFCQIFCLNLANATNAIAIVVNNEPITLYEINEAMKSLNLSRQKAEEALIADRIERAQIRKMGALVDTFELESEIKKLLETNEQDEDAFKMELSKKGVSWDDFKKDFRKELERRKLYEAVAGNAKIDYSEEGARNYYEINQDSFKLYQNISAIAYTSTKQEDLEALVNAKNMLNLTTNSSETKAKNSSANLLKNKRIKSENLTLNIQNADPRLLVFLSGIEENAFSPVLENDDSFIVYEVKSRANPQILPYEDIKDQVASVYINKQRQDYMKDFFDKLHAKANIEKLR